MSNNLSSEVIDYDQDFEELNPSLTRDSTNYKEFIKVLQKPIMDQQEQFLWLKDNIMNLDIAQGYHLDIIGRLVGQDRLLFSFNTEPYFGFEGSYQSETLSSLENPELGGYWNTFDNFVASTSRRLNDDEYRNVIKARIIKNNSRCTVNDLVEVVNLITFSNSCVVTRLSHTKIKIAAEDDLGLLTYFADLRNREGDILPIPYGMVLSLEQKEGSPPVIIVSTSNEVLIQGSAYHNDQEYVEVYVNDIYWGIYYGNDTGVIVENFDFPYLILGFTFSTGSAGGYTRFLSWEEIPLEVRFKGAALSSFEYFNNEVIIDGNDMVFNLSAQSERTPYQLALILETDVFDPYNYYFETNGMSVEISKSPDMSNATVFEGSFTSAWNPSDLQYQVNSAGVGVRLNYTNYENNYLILDYEPDSGSRMNGGERIPSNSRMLLIEAYDPDIQYISVKGARVIGIHDTFQTQNTSLTGKDLIAAKLLGRGGGYRN